MKKLIILGLMCLTVQFGFAQKSTDMSSPKVSPNGTMNYSVMDNAPQLSGCENAGTAQQKNKCTSDKIETFIQNAINKDIARNVLDTTKNNLVYIRFIVTKQGSVKNVGVRTNNPSLKREIIRIVKTLPSFSSGTHQGVNVDVSYVVNLQANKLLKNAIKN
ncbi:hypothetical protein [Kordia sp.]|uniref:energy transducer TonB n=1 Tax=Kordia sp. TaxID=1965332 RepID=UPI0025BD196A|nr:hypothetical protein [Kordia sp.]MCH2192861.1 hypothetical protein [Kordia sp.]